MRQLAELLMALENGIASSEWIIVSCATNVESHINRLLEALVITNSIPESKLMSSLILEIGDDFYRTWESRLRWLNRAFGITVSGNVEIQEYLLVAELRNALIHGKGELTPSQVRSLPKLLALKRDMSRVLGVVFNGVEMFLDRNVAVKSLELARRFVFHVDTNVLATHPTLAT
jgi:hypothetical protein